MAQIKRPAPHSHTVSRLTEFLEVSGDFHTRHTDEGTGMLSQLWYRGVSSASHLLTPGVYREHFTERAKALYPKQDDEASRLRLEREMLSQFRTAGAAFLKSYSAVDIYFTAQHFGMPTRLLDWSTNPLAALFLACDGNIAENGVVYAMDARNVIPSGAKKDGKESLPRAVMTMRHDFVVNAIQVSFWKPLNNNVQPYIVPVRPDVVPGRMGQQSSCFTFHAHQAEDADPDPCMAIKIDAGSKPLLKEELHRLNINQFTTYYDLDHLSKEIKRGFGFHS